MMVPEGILLLLFAILTNSFEGSAQVEIIVPERTETYEEGSSVTIPCEYFNKEDNLALLWFKDAHFDKDLQTFNGTIVYSNREERPQSLDYVNRVEYDANVISAQSENTWTKCNLRINDLQKTDSGSYSFRFIGSKKYMSQAMNLEVTDNPCKVNVDPSELKNPLMESEEFTVRCSTFGSCLKYPEWLVNPSVQKEEWLSSSLTDVIIKNDEEEGRKVTTLKLNVTWKDDKRILSCRPGQAKDRSQIRNITLSVEYSPKETTAKVSSEYVKEGDSVTLSCDSRGHPDVTFSWLINEQIEKSQQKSDLKLNNVKPEDSGEYYCETKNKHGTMKSNMIIIDVKYGPKGVTVKPLVSVEDLKEGGNLILKCSVNESNPPVTFKWYNNNNMQQQTSDTLTISNVKASDGGSYQCEADNGIKKETSNIISVSVKYSPRNVEIQGGNSVKVNSRLTLTCSGDANPKSVQYTWKHPPGLSSYTFPVQTGELIVDNVTIKHAGQYTCIVNNAIGSSSSNTFNVDVLYPPSNLRLIMKRVLKEFEVFPVICTVQSFPLSKLTVTGPKDFQNNQVNITESVNNLTIYLNVTESHAGKYKCKAENSEGQVETNQEELTVLYAPKNVTASSKGEQTFGSELTLTCGARSKPAPSSFEWMKWFNGQLKTVGHEQKLHFHSLNISDSGEFVCIANNSIGKGKSQSVHIRVKYTPNINIVDNRTAEWNWQLAVYLTCSADAYPPATEYKWYREEDNTTVLSHQQNFTVLPQNPGMYYCTAANRIGKSRSKHIKLFVSSYSKVLCQIILPIILLILIAVGIFLMRRTIIKARSDPQRGADNPLCFFLGFLSGSSTVANLLLLGSQNNTRENLSIDEIPDPCHGRVQQSQPTHNSQDPTRAQDLNPRSESNTHTVYSAIKLPPIKQGKCNPKSQKPGNKDNDLNYITLDFKKQNEPKRAPEDSAVYAMMSKNNQPKNSQSENHDYENFSSACASRLPFTNIDWESDSSEEDEVNYTTVTCSAKTDVNEPKHYQRSCLSSSRSEDENITEYSAIKT